MLMESNLLSVSIYVHPQPLFVLYVLNNDLL